MYRFGSVVLSAVLLVLLAPAVTANWVYLLPQSDRNIIQVIFADDLNPDPRVPIQRICEGRTKLHAIAPGAKPIEIPEADWVMDSQEQAFTFKVPQGTQAVAGTTHIGFYKVHGTEIRSRLTYYPKVLIDPVKESQKPCCEAIVPFEIVPLVQDGKLHFQALWQGRPIDKAFEMSVIGRSVVAVFPPDGKKMAMPVSVGDHATTNKGFAQPGRYAAWAVYTIAKPGIVDGKEYDEERYYATLVVDFAPTK
jgi:hypothetical protein